MFSLSATAFVPKMTPNTPSQIQTDTFGASHVYCKEAKIATEANQLLSFQIDEGKSQIKTKSCAHGNLAPYAHRIQQIANHGQRQRKNKNCKDFFKNGYCAYGDKCLYRHEHRVMDQIARYRHNSNLSVYQSLFVNSKDQSRFIDDFETEAQKLPIFEIKRTLWWQGIS